MEDKKSFLSKEQAVLAPDKMDEITPAEFEAFYEKIESEEVLAVAFAQASNIFWWVEDEVYDYEEDTIEYQKACEITDAWCRLMEKYEEMIFGILRSEGVLIPDTGRIKILVPFMERNGFEDRSGWWYPINK